MDYSLLLAVEEINEKSLANIIKSPQKNSSIKANKLDDFDV